ncbi:hypothetical protein [Sinorhizobium meliloti]|uniref:WYL domain-containing protein n=1 Tax=Rhizobium meliloti TaxID=382 RepID=A0AAW9U2N0_RHIML|nr:hypothetical protein [Sinorhizobium meliloti]MQW38158.1 hypothetical protein [Sinorhizobium meliloti]
MSFLLPDGVARWMGPLVISAVGLTVIFGNPITVQALCSGTHNCAIEWVGALSGWAALGGALLTIFVMTQQLEEQRRQSDFMTGNGSPDAYIALAVDQDEELLRWFPMLEIVVVNRNRRQLTIREFRFQSSDDRFDVFVKSVEQGGVERPMPLSMQLRTRYPHAHIAGKEEGQKAERCRILCHISERGEFRHFPQNPDLLRSIYMKVQLLGEYRDAINTPVALEAEANIQL